MFFDCKSSVKYDQAIFFTISEAERQILEFHFLQVHLHLWCDERAEYG